MFFIQKGMLLEIVDFIQGCVSGSVGVIYYLNKVVLVDEWYFVVVDDLKRVLEGGE